MSVSSASLGNSLASIGLTTANPARLIPSQSKGDAAAGDTDARNKAQNRDSRQTGTELSPEEQRRVAELKRIDAAVRAHEQAHITAGRGLITSGPRYEYTYGPDGKQYVVGGEVSIDTSPEQEPQANIEKGQRIQEAALAPIDPSPEDFSIAASGRRLEEQGRRDLRTEQAEQNSEPPRDGPLAAYAAPRFQANQLDVFA